MAFWSTADSEVKRNYRYRVTIQGKGMTASQAGQGAVANADVLYWAKAVTLPSFDVSNVEVHHFDNRYYFPGRVTWNPVSLTLVDPISVDAAKQVSQILSNAGYQVPDAENNKSTSINRPDSVGTAATNAAIFAVQIDIVDSENNTIEQWKLVNVFVESAK